MFISAMLRVCVGQKTQIVLYHPNCRTSAYNMFLKLVKSALFAAAAAVIVFVAVLFGVLQHRAQVRWNYYRYPEEGHPYRRAKLQSLLKLFWAIHDAVALWMTEGYYRTPLQETNPHPSVMV